jgi:hypothetical protein
MIRASKIIPIVDDNRQFQGISVTVYDNKIRRRKQREIKEKEFRKILQKAWYHKPTARQAVL